jgi:glycosyltransferase involved in cell wall biosynthesis
MTGFIKGAELGETLSNAGLFILPSYHEGLPIALLEAMSYNLPILASDIPANCELAQPEERFPVGNIEELRQKISNFISSPAKEQNTRKRVETEFNWDLVADATEKVYRELQF